MKINLSIEKKHILTLVIVICIISSIGYLVATPATPGVSHPADEVTPGPFAAGDYTFPGKLTLGNDPTDDMDAATKGYVDAAVDAADGGGATVHYIKTTTATYNGDLGGYSGANAKCNAEYSGYHICSVDEFPDSLVGLVGGITYMYDLSSITLSGDYGWVAPGIEFNTPLGDEWVYDCQHYTSSSSENGLRARIRTTQTQDASRFMIVRGSSVGICDNSHYIWCCQ